MVVRVAHDKKQLPNADGAADSVGECAAAGDSDPRLDARSESHGGGAGERCGAAGGVHARQCTTEATKPQHSALPSLRSPHV